MIKVLMLGPDRGAAGGISTVVNQYYGAALDEKIKLHYIGTMCGTNKFTKFKRAIGAFIEFKKYINHYNIVHIHMSQGNSFHRKKYFIKYAKRKGKKIVIHVHGSDFDDFYDLKCNKKQQKEIRDIFNLADVVITLSNIWREYFYKICNPNKIEVLHNAINIVEPIKNNYNDHNIVFLGRIGDRKGIFDFLDIFSYISEVYPDVKLFIGGDGEIEKCRSLCSARNLNNNVEVLGWINDVKKSEIFKKCSVFILPSYHEGMPMAILEAMSYGVAILASNVGGIPEVINDGINGLLCTPGDREDILNKMLTLIDNDILKSKYGSAAYETVKNEFDINRNILKLIEIYRKLLS